MRKQDMGAAEITAIIVGVGGILASLFTFISSARNSDLDSVKVVIQNQHELIETLQDGLETERARCTDTQNKMQAKIDELRKIVDDRDRLVGTLQNDLNEAQKIIRRRNDEEQRKRDRRW
jgi:peptidoglycan hydrolase CwlO-like protein